MLLQAFPTGPLLTNAYVVACEKSKEALIIDPGFSAKEPILSYLQEQKLKPLLIVCTHSHFDHIADVADLKEILSIPVYLHEKDAPNLKNPGADGIPLPFTITPSTPEGFLKEGDTIPFGFHQFQVIETPGHTPGGISLFEEGEKVLLSGDTLFKGSIGNLSFPGADKEAMWASLKKLAKLPKETKVYPGHGESTSLLEEPWLEYAEDVFS